VYFGRQKERWDGVPLRKDAALNVFGADEVFTTNEVPHTTPPPFLSPFYPFLAAMALAHV
jgi:hypothetical protein